MDIPTVTLVAATAIIITALVAVGLWSSNLLVRRLVSLLTTGWRRLADNDTD